MKCQIVQKKLIFFLEKELSGTEMQAIREHLDSCPDCALFAEEMKKTLSILDSEKNPEINPFFYTRVKAKLESQMETQGQTMRRPVLIRVLQPVAFSIILLLGVYGGIKLGKTATTTTTAGTALTEQEMVPYWNTLDDEPIESFLLD